MASSRVMSGARGKLGIYDPATGRTKVVGIFNNCSYGVTYDVAPAFIIGRFSAAELAYTSMEPVSITASGWRVIGHGPHADAGVPKLQDLLTHEYLTLVLTDRQSEANGADGTIAKFTSVRPTGYSTSLSARALEEITVNFTALMVNDESGDNTEHPTSTDLP